jgi:1,4-alpha-glucan branching enzyme
MRQSRPRGIWRIAGLALATALLTLAAACTPGGRVDPYAPRDYVELTHPEWAHDAVIYQINTRQFTEEGTFRAAQAQLPRLAELGVDILWLMPIHPIGEQNRKGGLGSPYAVQDYYGVNPEFGTIEDLRGFVDEAHRLGMHVILDWVANHTAWDNALVTEHPDWYERDWKGDFHPTPYWDWSDIIDLDYDQRGVREYMTAAMVYWVREVGVDGYRADVAGYVPLDFWENVRRELEAVKPVFMLAEFDQRDVHARAFDASYSWEWNNAMHDIAMGRGDVGRLFGYYSGNESAWPHNAYRLTYTSNHDQNAWSGTMNERFGPARDAAIVLSFVGEGIPMLYNGQEAGEPARLAFFEDDPIQWRSDRVEGLFRALIALKTDNPVLWNGAAGARMTHVINSDQTKVFTFIRRNETGAVFAAINLSPEQLTVSFPAGPHLGTYTEHFTGVSATFEASTTLTLPAWGYRVFVQRAETP